MSQKAVVRLVRADASNRSSDVEWLPPSNAVLIGKDVLELLSTSMYVDPMTIYREYIQNAADAIDQAKSNGELRKGRVDIKIDIDSRSIRMRDNGSGLDWSVFAERLINIGASTKRGTAARGFRGVGRLSGLGYCQSLIFRTKTAGESLVSELRWDGRKLKAALRGSDGSRELSGLINSVVTVRQVPLKSVPERFFEVEMQGVVRHRNDRLLNPRVVGEYLAQVAPVPFHPDFRFGEQISAHLRDHVNLGNIDIYINDGEEPIFRPHRNLLHTDDGKRQRISEVEFHHLKDSDGELGAVAWVAHHDYEGAIPTAALVKGVRFRTGNIQIGESSLLEELFSEPRFNSWAIGEVHIIDKRVIANGRRDHFEQGTHLDNLFNQLAPIARDISRRCRQSSLCRKWIREFQLHRDAALERARIIARGAISRQAKLTHLESARRSLSAMRKAAEQRHLPDDVRTNLTAEASAVESQAAKLLASVGTSPDPLDRFRPEARAAYRRVIDLIYECASNRAAATALVEKVLAKLTEQASLGKKGKTRTGRH